MEQKWNVDQFGVGLTGALDRYERLILELALDLVQIPLHIYLPSTECCERVIANGTKLIGKLVLPKNTTKAPLDKFETLFKRYKGLIKIWDFGGEPETRPHEPGCRFAGTPEEFTDLTRAFYGMGKSIDPDNTIGGCGWITPTFNGCFGNEDRSGFFRQCLALNIAEFLDFISLNFYLYGYGGTKNILVGVSKVNELLAWHHVHKPVVVSECGVPCDGDPAFYHIIQTPRRQAISLVEQNILFSSVGIDYSIWFALQYGGWGIYTDTGDKRESFFALKTMENLLKGSTYSRQIKALPSCSVEERWLTDKIQWHVFVKENKEIHVVWLTGGQSLIRHRPNLDIRVFDIFGHEILDSNSLWISDQPVYIVSEAGELNQRTFMRS